MDSFRPQEADIEGGVAGRLEGQAQAGLDAVWGFVILGEARDDRIAEEPAACDRPSGAETERSRVRICAAKHVLQSNRGNVGRAGERKESRVGVQVVFIRTSGKLARGSTAGRFLASQQRHGDSPVKQAAAAA